MLESSTTSTPAESVTYDSTTHGHSLDSLPCQQCYTQTVHSLAATVQRTLWNSFNSREILDFKRIDSCSWLGSRKVAYLSLVRFVFSTLQQLPLDAYNSVMDTSSDFYCTRLVICCSECSVLYRPVLLVVSCPVSSMFSSMCNVQFNGTTQQFDCCTIQLLFTELQQ